MGSSFSLFDSSNPDPILPLTQPPSHSITPPPLLSPTTSHTTRMPLLPISSFESPTLTALLGPTVPLSSPFWSSSSLFDLGLSLQQLSTLTSKHVAKVMRRCCQDLYKQTEKGEKNMQHLLIVLGKDLQSYPKDQNEKVTLDSLLNLLFLARTFLAFMLHTHNSDEHSFVLTELTSPILIDTTSPPLDTCTFLLSSLIDTLLKVPLTDKTDQLHKEILNTILTSLSSQFLPSPHSLPAYHLFSLLPTRTTDAYTYHPFLSRMINPTITDRTGKLMTSLLISYIGDIRRATKKPKLSSLPPTLTHRPSLSLLTSLSSTFTTLIRLPFQLYTYFFPPPPTPHPLADRSLALFLLLTHQTNTSPYRSYLHHLSDDTVLDSSTSSTEESRISFDEMYETCLSTIPTLPSILLLYTLLHLSPSFLSYVYAKTDIEELLLPLLKSLYEETKRRNAETEKTHHSSTPLTPNTDLYLILIIILILSHDSSFVTHIHKHLVLPSVYWHTDYTLTNISLASFILLLLARLYLVNLRQTTVDEYCQSNILACIGNICINAVSLHAATARRMVQVMEVLSKRFMVMLKKREMLKKLNSNKSNNGNSNNINNNPDNFEYPSEEEENSANSLLNSISTYLSSLCLALTPTNLEYNPHLLYWLLHERKWLDILINEVRFNINEKCEYLLALVRVFGGVMEKATIAGDSGVLTRDGVELPYASLPTEETPTLPRLPLQVFESSSPSSDPLNPLLLLLSNSAHAQKNNLPAPPFSALNCKFAYEEEKNSSDFFLPLVWDIISDLKIWSEKNEEQQDELEDDIDDNDIKINGATGETDDYDGNNNYNSVARIEERNAVAQALLLDQFAGPQGESIP